MRIFILFIILIIFVESCRSQLDQNKFNIDLKVLNDTFLQIVGTNFYRAPYNDSVHKVDSSKIIFLVNDTLNSILKTDSTISEYSDYLLRKKISLDSEYLSVYHNLFNKSVDPVKINLKEIKNTGLYVLLPTFRSNSIKSTDRIVGIITFSRISFNNDKTLCCFYVSLDCGNDCGYGYLVFCKNINDKWQKEYDISLFQR